MARCAVSTTIDAPPEDVWAHLVDIERYPELISGIKGVEKQTEGPVGVGTRFRETRVMFGKEATEEMEFAAVDPPRSFELVAESHGARHLTTTSLAPESGGTRVEMTFETTPVKLLAKLMMPLSGLMLKSCRKAMEQDLADVKAAIESVGAEPAAGSPPDAGAPA